MSKQSPKGSRFAETIVQLASDSSTNIKNWHKIINCHHKNCERLGQRFILAIVLPKDTLLTYGVRFNFTYRRLVIVTAC